MKRLCSVLGMLLALQGCFVGGARANGGGACPSGEVCSAMAPMGLLFRGTQLGDRVGTSGITTIAVGGRGTINVRFPNSTSSEVRVGVSAATANTSVLRAAGGIPTAEVTALGAGTTALRIVETGSPRLLDKISVSAANLASITIHPTGSLDPRGPEILREAWALFRGSSADVVVTLRATGAQRLVDESLQIVPEGSTEFTARQWDAGRVSVRSGDSLSLRLRTGALETTAVLPVVDTIDSIQFFPNSINETMNDPMGIPTVENGSGDIFCFNGRKDGRLVVGVPMTFSAAGPFRLRELPPNERTLFANGEGCVELDAVGEGSGTLSVSALGRTFSLSLRAVPMVARQEVQTSSNVNPALSIFSVFHFEPGVRALSSLPSEF